MLSEMLVLSYEIWNLKGSGKDSEVHHRYKMAFV